MNSIKASGSKVPMLNPSPIPISCAEITLDVLSFAASGKVRILMAMRFELIKCSFRPCHFTLGVENRFWSQIL